MLILTQLLHTVQYLHQHHLPHLYINPGKIFCITQTSGTKTIKLDAIGQILPENLMSAGVLPRKYRAPELQRIDSQPSPCCDIFSIGILGYQMLTGIFPYPPKSLLTKDATPHIPPFQVIKPDISVHKNFENVIFKAMAWRPRQRYQNTGEFLKELLNVPTEKNFSYIHKKWIVVLVFITLVYLFHPKIILWFCENIKHIEIPLYTAPPLTSVVQLPKNKLPKRPSNTDFAKQIEYTQSVSGKIYVAEDMCHIPAGNVLLGEEERLAFVNEFYIDRMEVSNQEYELFIRATGCTPPIHWKGINCPSEQKTYPVVYVNWYSANLYAIWCKKRLPSEIEWERAAHGDQYKRWPWGNAFGSGFANIESKNLMPVGSFTYSPTIFGPLDMVGNVWEWTNSWYVDNQEHDKVIRGGGYSSSRHQSTTSYRDGFFPESCRDDIGFRCAKDKQ